MQWNINGYRSKSLHLQELIQKLNLKILALQETKLEADIPLKIKDFNKIYRKDRNRHGGGVCITVHNSIPSYEIKIKTDLEIIVIRVIF